MGVFSSLWGPLRRSRSGSFRGDGSSRRGRRFGSGSNRGQEEPSNKGESSTHSALFDLELSSRGRGSGAGDLLARLNSTVHDEGSAGGGADPSVRLPSGLLQRIIYLGRPVMEFELDLLQDVRSLRSTCQLQPDGQLDLSSLATQLQDLGYACYLKHNNPADPGHRHNVQPSCLEKLRHEFIMVAGRADGSLSHWCLVDPRFREQFAIAQPTPAYERLLKAVPLEFVGTPLRLQALVETLCGEMAEAFAAQQRTLPPWRKFKSMLSKWFDPQEMPSPPVQLQAAQAPPPVQLQAAAGPPLSPFEAQAQAQAAGAGGFVLRSEMAAAGKPPSLLQQQAAAALAERQSSGGGSQDFFEALEMHKQSMRLQQQQQQQQQVAGTAQRSSPTRSSPTRSSPPQQQQRQQQVCPAALSRENLRQLDAAYSSGGSSGSGASAGDAAAARQSDRSNKPRRRRPPPAGLSLATGSRAHHVGDLGCLFDEEEGPDGGLGGGFGPRAAGLSGAHMAQAQLHNSGSWSELSTILEARSNASSPAAAALMVAGNAQLGTSCASRRSACSVMATAVAMAAGGAGAGAAPLPLPLAHRSPGRLDQVYAAHSAAGSSACGEARQQQQQQQHMPSPGTSLVGFSAAATLVSAAPLARSSLAKTSGAPSSSAQPPSSSSGSGGGSSPVAGVQAAAAAAAAGGGACDLEGGSARGGKKKVVSLLAKGLKSVGQKNTWSNLLPTVNTVRRVGPNGPTTAQQQRNWSWRGSSEDGSSRRGRKAAAAAAAAGAAQQQQQQPAYPLAS